MSKPVFVVGCDRSGTTLLSLLLSQSPDLHFTLESGFIPDLYDKRADYRDFTTARQRWFFIRDLQNTEATSKTIAFDIFELTEDQAEETISRAAPTNYAGAIDALFSKTAEIKEKNHWGNKTPKYVQYISLLTTLFPGAKIIHIIRDPRDVAASIQKAGWTNTIREAAFIWQNRVGAGLKGRSLGDDTYYELKYEFLLEHPTNELKKLHNWLEIQYNEDILDQYQSDKDRMSVHKHDKLFDLIGRPIDKTRAFAWKRNMKNADIAEIEEVTGKLIQKLGYELTNTRMPIVRKLYRYTYDFMLSKGKKIGKNISKKL